MADSLLFGVGGLRSFAAGSYSGAGPSTAAVICKPTIISGYRWLLCVNNSAGNGAIIGDSAGILKVYDGGSDPSGPSLAAADEWYLIAVTKAAGTATPRGHIYRYSTAAWTHADFGGTQGQFAAWSTVRFVDAGTGWSGNVLVAGLWDSVLSDATIETLAFSLPDWTAAAPAMAWRFDTVSAITPFAGSGAQLAAGTETLDVGDAPAGWSDAPDTEPPAYPATGLLAIVEAMAAALEPVKTAIPELQVYPFLNQNPTPPSIDIYPADPFQTGSGFEDDTEAFFTVRARTTTADHEAGQKALLRMLDRRAAESVEEALTSDQTLGGTAQAVAVAAEGVSGYRAYLENPESNANLIGCEWRVMVIT